MDAARQQNVRGNHAEPTGGVSSCASGAAATCCDRASDLSRLQSGCGGESVGRVSIYRWILAQRRQARSLPRLFAGAVRVALRVDQIYPGVFTALLCGVGLMMTGRS